MNSLWEVCSQKVSYTQQQRSYAGKHFQCSVGQAFPPNNNGHVTVGVCSKRLICFLVAHPSQRTATATTGASPSVCSLFSFFPFFNHLVNARHSAVLLLHMCFYNWSLWFVVLVGRWGSGSSSVTTSYSFSCVTRNNHVISATHRCTFVRLLVISSQTSRNVPLLMYRHTFTMCWPARKKTWQLYTLQVSH